MLQKTFSILKQFNGVDYFIFYTKNIFNFLQNILNERLIFYYFDLKYYIHVKTNILSYKLARVRSQLIINILN